MKRAMCILTVLGAVAGAAPALADEALARSKNCMACHTIEKKLVGPAYKDVARKYASDAGAADRLAGKIRQGSSGVWGAVPMPPNAGVSETEAAKLAAWVLSLK